MTDKNSENINNSKPENRGNRPLSDEVIIQIVHAFKDIIIEFIDKRYDTKAELQESGLPDKDFL